MGDYTPRVNIVSRTGAGVVGGVAGGVILGLVLMILGEIKPYAQLVGETSLSSAWVMVLVIGGISGGLQGAYLGRFITGQIVPAIGVGLVWGMMAWLVLAMLILPIRGDIPFFDVGDFGLVVLGAYIASGVTTAVVYAVAGPRRRYYYRRRPAYGMMMAMPTRATPRTRTRSRSRSRKRRDDD